MAVLEREERPRTAKDKPKAPKGQGPGQITRPTTNSIVRSTGETFGKWFGRRYKSVEPLWFLPLPARVGLASSKLTDTELSGIVKGFQAEGRVRTRETTKQLGRMDLPSPLPSGATPSGGSVAPAPAQTQAELQERGKGEFFLGQRQLGAVAQYTATGAFGLVARAASKLGEKIGSGSTNVLGAVGETIAEAAGPVGRAAAKAGGVAVGTVIDLPGIKQALDAAEFISREAVLEPGSAVVQTLQSVGEGLSADEGERDALGRPFKRGFLGLKYSLTPAQAYRNANRYGPGTAIAQQSGLRPGSSGYQLLSATIDFTAYAITDPLAAAGRVGKVAKVARRVPGAAAMFGKTRRFSLPQTIERQTAQMLSRTPEQLVSSRLGRSTLDRFWKVMESNRVPRGVNLSRVAKEYGDIADSPAITVLSMAQSRKMLDDLYVDLLYGRPTGLSRSMVDARVRRLETELAGLRGAPDDVAEEIASLEHERKRFQQLRKMFEEEAPPAVRALPDPTWSQRLRLAIREGGTSKLTQWTSRVLDSDWARTKAPAWASAGVLPTRDIPLIDRESGRETVESLGRLLGIKRPRVHEHVTQYLQATSKEEARDIVLRMLREGRDTLPAGVGVDLTTLYDGTAVSFYTVQRSGAPVTNWTRTKVVDGETYVYNQPIFWYQHADELPLPPIREIINAKSVIGRVQRGLQRQSSAAFGRAGRFSKAAREAAAKAGKVLPPRRVYQGVQRALGGSSFATASILGGTRRLVTGFTNAIWIPAVLMRPSWIMRVVGDEQARMAALGMPVGNNFLDIIGRMRGGIDDVPERALANMGRMAIDYRPNGGILRPGERGHIIALQHEMVALHNDPVVKRLLKYGEADTVTWLTTGKGRKYLNDTKGTLATLDGGPRSAEQWVAFQREQLGRFDAPLLEAIKTGRIGDVGIQTPFGLNALRQSTNLPAAVVHGQAWVDGGNGVWKRAVEKWFDWAGNKPTNYLSRAPAFRYFRDGELARYKALGVPEKTAERLARDYATRQVGNILYDGARRTAGDVALKNFAPFLPAWKEVFTRWTKEIPNTMGLGLGQVVLARKLDIMRDALENAGSLERDERGELRVVFGNKAFAVRSINMLGSMPFSGPVPGTVLAQLIKGSEKWEEFFEPLFPAGMDAAIFPAWAGRVWTGLTGDPAPWEPSGYRHQRYMFASNSINWARTQSKRLDEISKLSGEDQRRAVEGFVEDMEASARGQSMQRARDGVLLPISPRRYWPGEREVAAFRKSIEKLEGAEYGKAIRDFIRSNPEFEYYFRPKSTSLKNYKERENRLDNFWLEWRKGNIKQYSPEQWVWLALGQHEFDAIRQNRDEQLARLGDGSAAAMLKNASEWQRINDEARVAIDALKYENPTWRGLYDERIRLAKQREGDPLPTAEEEQVMNFTSTFLPLLREKMRDMDPLGDTYDLAGVKQLIRDVRAQMGVDRFYSDAELPPGPQRDLARWFDEYFGPYWEEISRIRSETIDRVGATSADRSKGYRLIQEYRDSYAPPVIDGVEFPSPEEFGYQLNTDERKEAIRIAWVAKNPAHLTRFERSILKLGNDDQQMGFWHSLQRAEQSKDEYLRANNISPNSNDGKALKEQLQTWARERAARVGMEDEYELSLQPPYKRMDAYAIVKGSDWDRIVRSADAARAYMAQEGVTDEPVKREFYAWLTGLRRAKPEIEQMFAIIGAAMPRRVRENLSAPDSSLNGLYPHLFFKVS